MPFYTVNKVVEGLNGQGRALQGAKVLVLGTAFKRDIDDARNSPAVEVLKILWTKGAQVSYHDPYVPELHLEEPSLHGTPVPPLFHSVPLTEETMAGMDCVVIAVSHSCFDIPWLMKHSRLVVDAQNATRGLEGLGAQIVRL
jgi:UDP-N-acetyl-D-glucosamine dehydrogenase